MGNFWVSVETVLPLFLIILAGSIFSRATKDAERWVEILNKYALYIGFPALIIASLANLKLEGQNYSTLLLANSAYILICLALVFPLSRLFRMSREMKRALWLILPFGNIAYLGMPVLENAFGENVLPVAAIISAIYVFWLLTAALFLIEVTGDSRAGLKIVLLRLVQNPLLVAVFIGLLLIAFDLQLPGAVSKTVSLFAGSVTAVVLFSLGIFLGIQKIGKRKEWYAVFMWVFVTMLFLPFLYYLVLPSVGLPTLSFKSSILDAAMPLGLTPYALSVQYRIKTTLLARIVVLGTLLSVIILPFWMMVLGK